MFNLIITVKINGRTKQIDPDLLTPMLNDKVITDETKRALILAELMLNENVISVLHYFKVILIQHQSFIKNSYILSEVGKDLENSINKS